MSLKLQSIEEDEVIVIRKHIDLLILLDGLGFHMDNIYLYFGGLTND